MGWNIRYDPNLVPSGGGGTAESDWVSRSTAAGVVWAHDFRSDAEVNNFRWTGGFGSGNDPLGIGDATAPDCRRIVTDGIGDSKTLEIVRRAGTTECAASWWRPFVPVTSPGNGKATNDPGANGTITPLSYTPTSGGSETNDIVRGYYGHSSYAGANFDGTEFYLQMRVKMDPRRMATSADVGKLLYLTTSYRSLTSQEIVTYSRGDGGNQGTQNYFRLYGGWQVFYPLDQEVSPADGIQPGSDSSADWYYSGGWDTIMYHLVMGRAGVDETLIECFAAHEGETSFTKIWSQVFAFSEFEWNNGLNALIASTYNNGNNITSEFYHRYTQFIFSKSFIPCPQFPTAPSWWLAAPELTLIDIAGGTAFSGSAYQKGTRITDVAPSPASYPNGQGAEGVSATMNDWTGGCVYQANCELLIPAQGGHNGYYCNEVYALGLRQEVPGWQRIWGPTPNAQIVTSEYSPSYNPPYTGYADGAPRTSHGWFSVMCTRDGRIITTFQDANPSGTWDTGCYSLNRNNTAAGWTFHGRLWETLPGPAGSFFLYQSGPGAYDSVADKFYRAAEGAVADPANGVVGVDVATMLAAGQQSTSTGPQTPGSTLYNHAYGTALSDAWSVVLDDMSPRCWVIGAVNSNQLWILNLDNPTAAFVEKTTTGSPTGFVQGCNAVYHRRSRAILVGGRELGTSLRKLAITGSDPLTATYAWSNISLGGSTPPADGNFQGTYSKFQLIDDMGDGRSALVMVTQVTGAAKVIKLPMAGV